MKTGDIVKMSEDLKKGLIHMDCEDHVNEFGDCEGVVEDKVWNDEDDVNVRWQPSGLRYAYDPNTLIKIN